MLSAVSTLAASVVEDSWMANSWNTENGLPNNTVKAITQTTDGFLWIGTDNGLARFDGKNFRVFTPQNTPTLGNARIRSLCADDTGALWILTVDSSLVCLRAGKFINIATDKKSPRVTSLAFSGGALWYAGEKGTLGTFQTGALVPLLTNFGVGSLGIFPKLNGGVFAADNHGVHLVETGKTEALFEDADRDLRFFAPGRHGLWLGTDTAWMQLQDSNRISSILLESNMAQTVQAAREDRKGNLWLATEQQGIWCRAVDGKLQNFTSTNGLGGDSFSCIFEDQQGAIWTGGEGSGLNRLRPRTFHTLPQSAKFFGESVTAVCAGRPEELWIGTERHGLARMVEGELHFVGTNETQIAKRIRSLKFDSTERLWVGTQDLGLFYFDSGRWEPFRGVPEARSVSALFEDDRWGLWIGSVTSNTIFRLVGEAPQRFTLPLALATLDVRTFSDDGAGGLWIGTQGDGLLHWNGRDFQKLSQKEGLGSDTIWSLLLDASDDALWIGTAGGGLNRIKSGNLQSCTKQNGLYENIVSQILDDRSGWLWFSSPKGIYRISKQGLQDFFVGRSPSVQSVAYGLEDGLPSLECVGGTQPAGCRSSDGRMWWPTAKGLTWVNPSGIPKDSKPPSVVVDQLLVDNKEVEFKVLSARSDMESNVPPRHRTKISPGLHRIEFRYTALSWMSPEFVRFRHKLAGFDQDWVEAGFDRAVQYLGLPPNDYDFQVIAANREGVWSPVGPSVLIEVQPFFWQTWLFKTATVAALVAGAGLGVTWVLRRRHQLKLLRLERLHAVEQERARIAQDIHDDLGASLTEIALLSELAQSRINEPNTAREHLDSIFNNARNLARTTDEIVWALHPKNNSLEVSLGFITRSAQEFLRAAKLRCRLDFPRELPDLPMASATRHHLYLCVKEALNNVVKHGGATEVWLRLRCESKSLILSVEDNGQGFNPHEVRAATKTRSAAGRGQGLHSMAQRMQAVGGSFEQTSEAGRGTVTRFTVPLRS